LDINTISGANFPLSAIILKNLRQYDMPGKTNHYLNNGGVLLMLAFLLLKQQPVYIDRLF